MLNFILFIIFFLILMSSLFYNIVATLKIKKLIQSLFQVNLDYFIVADQLKKSNVADNEAFTNFLLKSRDDAFAYIEIVQQALNKFKDEAGPVVDYHKKYGDVMYTPNTDSLNKLVTAYEELMVLLPKEEDNQQS
jgi:hypothetical protein